MSHDKGRLMTVLKYCQSFMAKRWGRKALGASYSLVAGGVGSGLESAVKGSRGSVELRGASYYPLDWTLDLEMHQPGVSSFIVKGRNT